MNFPSVLALVYENLGLKHTFDSLVSMFSSLCSNIRYFFFYVNEREKFWKTSFDVCKKKFRIFWRFVETISVTDLKLSTLFPHTFCSYLATFSLMTKENSSVTAVETLLLIHHIVVDHTLFEIQRTNFGSRCSHPQLLLNDFTHQQWLVDEQI